MGKFRDTRTGETIELPDNLPEGQEGAIIQQIFNAEPVLFGEPIERRKTLAPQVLDQRQRSAEEQIGAPLTRGEELNMPGLRFDVARSNLLSEKINKIKESAPGLEIKVFEEDGESRIALRKSGAKEFVLLDSEESFTFSDVADIGGMVLTPETALEIAAAIRTRGGSLVKRAVAEFGAGSIGRAIDIGIEEARGLQDDPLAAIFPDILLSGTAAAGGEILFAPARRGVRALGGSGAVSLTPEELAASRTAREAGVPGLTPGQVQPLAQRLEQQSAATSKPVQTRRLEQVSAMLKDLENMRDAIGRVDMSDAQLEGIAIRAEEDIHALVTFKGEISPEKAGRALKKGRRDFTRIWKGTLLKRRYDDALRAGEEVGFDLTPAIERADEMLKGIRAKTMPGEATGKGTKVTVKTSTETTRREGELVTTKVVEEKKIAGAAGGREGRTITTTPADPEKAQVVKELRGTTDIAKAAAEEDIATAQLQGLNQEFRNLLETISSLDPKVQAFEGNTAFEQIKALRTQFFDLKNAAFEGGEDINNRLAGQMWDVLKGVMETPVGGDPAFKQLLVKANKANATFERILEITDIKRIATETSPDKLVDSLAKPGSGFTLRVLKRIVPEEKFKVFTDGYKTRLLREPEKILSTLDAFRRDPQALNLLMTREEQAEFRRFGRGMMQMKTSSVAGLMQRQTSVAQRSRKLILTGSADELAGIVTRSGGKNSANGRTLAAATVQVMLDESTIIKRGKAVMDPKKFLSVVRRLEQDGTLDAVLQPGEIARIKSREGLASLLATQSDAGASIKGAEIASDVGAVLTIPIQPIKGTKRAARGLIELGRNALMGKLLTSDLGAGFLVGFGKALKQKDFTSMRALSVITAQVSAKLATEAEKNDVGKNSE